VSQHPTRFQVDLRGVVELLSRHLYSSPRVYVRELAQNGVDAVTARGDRGGDERPAVRLQVHDDGTIDCHDAGAGLTTNEVERFLATIGSSSKRDELGFQREDLLGQFGIGLLSAFLVADQIEVVSRSATGTSLVRWVGTSDGTYRTSGDVDVTSLDEGTRRWLADGPGTCVRLRPRHDAVEWTRPAAVLALATSYLAHLPHRVELRLPSETHQVAPTPQPWLGTTGDKERYARERLGIDPFAVVPLTVPEAGVRGMAVVGSAPLPEQHGHRVYLRGMLLGLEVPDVAPPWAAFCRIVVDTTLLRPTASREQLYDDELAELTRRSIGEQLLRWIRRLAATDPDRMARFLSVHSVALKGAAVHDDDLADLLVPLLPFESTRGTTSLAELAAGLTVASYVGDVDEYRQVAPVAGAQGLVVLNAGYVHDAALLSRYVGRHPETRLTRISPREVDVHLDHVDAAREAATAAGLQRAEAALESVDVAVQLRRFAPATLPALLLDDRGAWRARDSRATAATADDTFAALLASVDDVADPRPRLILNDAHPTVHRVFALSDPGAADLAVQSLYARALLAGRHPVRPVDNALVERSFSGLLDALVEQGQGGAR
jgi:molecular chaperone HtpG